jgi:hypothetical protein
MSAPVDKTNREAHSALDRVADAVASLAVMVDEAREALKDFEKRREDPK